MGHSKVLEVPFPVKKIGDNSFILKIILGLYQFLQKNKVLFASLGSENKQKILNDACMEIGTCRKAIKTRRIAIKDGLVVNEPLALWVNLFREV